eukprot:Gb_02502 [translate_table: standard]
MKNWILYRKKKRKFVKDWERRVAFVLVNYESGAIFEALGECLKTRSVELAKPCFITSTWLTCLLTVLPDTCIRDVACRSLLEQFVMALQSSRNLERNLAMLALTSFINDSEVAQANSSMNTEVHSLVQSRVRIFSGHSDGAVKVHDMKDLIQALYVSGNMACFIPQGSGIKIYHWSGSSKLVNLNKNVKCLAIVAGKIYCGCTD